MKITGRFVLAFAAAPGYSVTWAFEHLSKGRSKEGLKGVRGTSLNTNGVESHAQRAHRLRLLGMMEEIFGEGEITPPFPEDEFLFLEELYNPMEDAKCFNDNYQAPTVDKDELYADYKKIFDWGLENPPESPLFDFSTGVTNGRFPGMCLRMVFHDNTIVGQGGAEYVDANIDARGAWIGDYIMMETSGGDASVLTCKPERFHPNNNYDETASRILHAFQSSANYPQGPGIGNGSQSLMSKYGFSYADALHNCALAAVMYMSQPASGDNTLLEVGIDQTDISQLSFSFGRKDACYITDDAGLLFSDDTLGANSRRPLCGPSEVLPGVTLSAQGVSDWFESRGMLVGVWLSLFGTHTALDNFSDPEIIRNFGLPNKDYFEDFVGCPFHKLEPPVTDPEDGGCDWKPVCNGQDGSQQPWHLVQSDCATSIDIIDASNDPSLDKLQAQMQFYIDNPGEWIPDVICALAHLGGDNESCIGPNSIERTQQVSLFGSVYHNSYPVPRTFPCANLDSYLGKYYNVVNQQSGLPLTIEGSLTDPGANLYQGSTAPGATKNWHLEGSNGYYRIISEHSGLAVTVEGGSRDNGANIIQETAVPGNEQYDWCFKPQGNNGYEVWNRHTWRSWDATQSGGLNVLQWGFWGGLNQQWRLEYVKDMAPTPPPTPGPTVAGTPPPTPVPTATPIREPYPNTADWECQSMTTTQYIQIVNMESQLPLCVEEGSVDTGANIKQCIAGMEDYKLWKLEPTSDGFYKIIAKHSDKVTAAAYASEAEGVNVEQRDFQTGRELEWCFRFGNNGGYEVRNRFSKQGLDAQRGSDKNVLLWGYWGGRNQEWVVNPADPTSAPTLEATPAPTPAPTLEVTPAPTLEVTPAPTLATTADPGEGGEVEDVFIFELIHAPSGVTLAEIRDGDLINIGPFGVTEQFNVVAIPVPTNVTPIQSVSVNGQNDNAAPFTFCGVSTADVCPVITVAAGPITMSVVPYTGPNQSGTQLPAVPITFQLVANSNLFDASGFPIGRPECLSIGDDVGGYPCSPFTISPFMQVLPSTAAFNPGEKQSSGEVCREGDNHCAMVFEYDVVGVELELFSAVIPQCVGMPTKLISYGGTVPGHTMRVTTGKEAFVQFNNKITQAESPRPEMFNGEGCDVDGKQGVPLTVHNHGQASIAPFDGYAIDLFCLDESKAYQYPNNRPTTGWFHDHAIHQTAENVMYGLFGMYIIDEHTSTGGCGDPYNLEFMEEVHLILGDYSVSSDCQVFFDFDGPHDDSYFGDVNIVNGMPFPALSNMERKWYHFRSLNAAVSRPFLLKLLTPSGTDLSASLCTIIATDGGYLELGPQPFPGEGLMIGVAERWEFVCDFTQLPSDVTSLVLYNDFDEVRMKDVPYFKYSHFLAKFEFNAGPAQGNPPAFDPNDRGNIGTFAPLTVLEEALPQALQMAQNGEAHHTFDFGRTGGLWSINGETWDSARVAADDIGQNTWEVWEIDTGGGWFHPVHIHLVDFFILSHESVDGVTAPDVFGQSGAPKDVMYLGPGETIYVLARFGPHRGEFMLHCHNLIHEDHDMLRTFIVAETGVNTGNLDQEFQEVNGIIYDNYQFADPLAPSLLAFATANAPPTLEKAQEFLDANFYRIFYPLPDDVDAVLNNPWLAPQLDQCNL